MSFRIWCLRLFLFSSFTTVAITTVPAAQKPNIILCMADDQGWGDVGYYNHPHLKTPTLDDMAASGLRFDRFYAAAPVCSPTRGSVMTGRHPNRFGCFRWGYTLRPQEITVAEALKTAGYVTGHFGKWHLGSSLRADSPYCPGTNGFDEWFSSPNFYENNPLMSHNGKVVETKGEGSKVTVDASLKFIRTAVKNKQPFLAVVWFGSPHGPHIAIERDLELYKDHPKKVQNFYGEITAMDRAIGNLRDELRKLDITGNTLFWYTSDNGVLPVGSARNLSGRKGNLLEGGIRVPAIIEWPDRIKQPRITTVPACTTDIYPTLLDLLDVSMPDQPILDGISLVPLIDKKMTRREKPLGFWSFPAGGRPVRSMQLLRDLANEQSRENKTNGSKSKDDATKITKQYPEDKLLGPSAWIENAFKLHRRVSKQGKVTFALHNLVTDPAEKSDIAADNAGRVERMKTELESWQTSVIRSLNGEDYVK